MANFADALKYVMQHEGGWSDHIYDRGGPTNYGITLKTAQKYGIASTAALRAMTHGQAAMILRDGYWRFDGVCDQRAAAKVFDMAVNMGPGAAIKYLQQALNDSGANVKVDGVYGPRTEAALNSVEDTGELLEALCAASIRHYKQIVVRDPNQGVFLGGWLKRAARTPGEL